MGLEKLDSNVELALDKVSASDLSALKRMGNRKQEDNPIRVHKGADDALIVAVGTFAADEEPVGPRFGLSAELIGTIKKAASEGSFYLILDKNGPSTPTSKPHVDLSTGHLRRSDFHLLEDIAAHVVPAPLQVYDHGYGWIIGVKNAGTVDELKAVGLSDEITALVDAARESGADYIDFDADADLDPGFPEYDVNTDEKVEAVSAPSM